MITKIEKFITAPISIKIQIFQRRLYFFKKLVYGQFGRNSLMQKSTMIYNRRNIFIGNNVTIRANARIEPIKRWEEQAFNPQISIGDGTNIEQNCHITCCNKINIGKRVTITGYVCISDIEHEYENIEKGILQQPLIVKETIIEDESFIGMGARIMPGVRIGKHCIIGSNCVVNKNIPDYSVVVGIPCKIIKRYNFNTHKWEKTNEKGKFLTS